MANQNFYSQTKATLDLMKTGPVIPVMTVMNVEDGLSQARALVAGGLRVLEITLRTPSALDAIAAIVKQVPGAIVGAGTITNPDQMAQALTAGAQFLVSPGTGPTLARAAASSPVPFLPGIATASEAMILMELGFEAMKFFPAEAAGGLKYLNSINGPLGGLKFCPTGGIDLEKARSYLASPNVLCVGGSWMLPQDALKTGDYARVEKLALEASMLGK